MTGNASFASYDGVTRRSPFGIYSETKVQKARHNLQAMRGEVYRVSPDEAHSEFIQKLKCKKNPS